MTREEYTMKNADAIPEYRMCFRNGARRALERLKSFTEEEAGQEWAFYRMWAAYELGLVDEATEADRALRKTKGEEVPYDDGGEEVSHD